MIRLFHVFLICLFSAFLVPRLSSSQYEGSLRTQSVSIPFRQYKYSYVHEAFRSHNQTIHKFVTNDTSYPLTNYVMKQNMVWDHRSVCSNDTFVFLFYLVSQKDYERRQLIREYVKQNMTVDGKQINYMIVVATDNKTEISGLEKENELYHDLLVSVHVDNYANLTQTVLDSFMWIREYCNQPRFIAKVDGDAWVHFGNLVHYLKTVPSTGFYGSYLLKRSLPSGFKYKAKVQVIPKDYPKRDWIFAYGAAYILSVDLVPFINIGTEYVDIILSVAEDIVVGEIMRLIDVKIYEQTEGYIYCVQYRGQKSITPPNAIFIHNLKAIPLLSQVYRNYSSTYTVPFYKDYPSC